MFFRQADVLHDFHAVFPFFFTDSAILSLSFSVPSDFWCQDKRFPQYTYTVTASIFSHSITYRHFSKDRVEALRKECAKGKPVILVQHVPFVDQNNPAHKKLHAWNGRIQTNQPGTAALVKLLTAPNGPVKLIVSGHNHTNIDFMWTPTLRSRVFDAAFRGYVGIIKIRKK
jgi:hypothetical protein